jgi:aminoglycoside phosphotransferase (APT) family kinase protein
MAAIGQVEVRFYTELAGQLGVRVPRCVYAGIDPDSGHGMILMRDLKAAGSNFLTALSPYSVDQAAATLEQLALMHAHDISTITLSDDQWVAPRLNLFLSYVTEERLQVLMDDGRAAALPASVTSAARIRAGLGAVMERSRDACQCYIHGDAHAGNLYLDSNGEPGLIDWQLVQRGSWALDVAYHLGAVLEVEDRRQHEEMLLSHYLNAVRGNGGHPPHAIEAWDLYREAFAYGYFLWAITQRVERPVLETFVHRLGTAVVDHETFERLGV